MKKIDNILKLGILNFINIFWIVIVFGIGILILSGGEIKIENPLFLILSATTYTYAFKQSLNNERSKLTDVSDEIIDLLIIVGIIGTSVSSSLSTIAILAPESLRLDIGGQVALVLLYFVGFIYTIAAEMVAFTQGAGR